METYIVLNLTFCQRDGHWTMPVTGYEINTPLRIATLA